VRFSFQIEATTATTKTKNQNQKMKTYRTHKCQVMTAKYVTIGNRQLCCYKNAAASIFAWSIRKHDGEWTGGFPISKKTMRGILTA
jgi:hypothetical protein